MSLLLIDIGRGTQDILLYRPGEEWENSIQLILPSPTVTLARVVKKGSAAGEDFLFTGVTMGGGPLTKAVRGHMERGGKVWATLEASATFDDDPEEVRAMGIEILGDEEAWKMEGRRGVRTIRTADVDVEALEKALRTWGIECRVQAVAVAVQDHGRAPRGVSDRRFRFQWLRERLLDSADLKTFAFDGADLPEHLTRMQGVRRSLEDRGPLLLMDTGFAALLGMRADPVVDGGKRNLLLNVGNGHTLAGILEKDELCGIFEHHTHRLDAGSLMEWLDMLVDGSLLNEEIYHDGGHGAFLTEPEVPGSWEKIDVFAATGPRRSKISALSRRPYLAAPYGQMMQTGNCGLYRAWRALHGEYTGD